ncbi:MAG TPA: hypothetical protein VHK88_04650, partial [Aquihabitans sp.]|nr:hypothetical protein [Aquihabitans sp.]
MTAPARLGGGDGDAGEGHRHEPGAAPADGREVERAPRLRPPLRQVGVLAALTLLTRLPGLVTGRSFNTDEATLGIGGRAMAAGGELYVDVLDRKPPLPFLAYRVVGTDDLRLVRALVAILILATAVVLADEARRRWGGRAGWVAGLVVVLGSSALGPNDAQAANFELFALLPIAVAVVAAARGWAATAGVALAVAVLCKQPAAVTIVPVAWCWWRTGRWAATVRGLVAGGVAGLALMAPFGIGRVLDWALLGTGGYLGMEASDLGFAAGRLAALVGLAVAFWGGAWLLAAAPRAAGGRAEVAVGRRHEDLDLWLLLGASVVGVVAGFRFFPHYLVQLLPALALLAARGATRRPAWVRPAVAWAVVASLAGAGLAWQVAVTDAPDVETSLAAHARRTTDAGDRILVWGNVPEVYWLADRQPAGGFTHSEFVTGYSGGRRPRTT